MDFSGNLLLPEEAASVVRSETLPYLPANKLICHGFMRVGRRHDIPRSVTKDLLTPSTATSMSFRFVSAAPLALVPTGQCKEGQLTHAQIVGCVTEEEP